jgi:hypothetical protein
MEKDPQFFDRADAHIDLSNSQIGEVERGKVSASMMFATARFNAWVSACGFENGADMLAAREETVEYFVTEYRKMLLDNLTQYIENFDSFMKARRESGEGESK